MRVVSHKYCESLHHADLFPTIQFWYVLCLIAVLQEILKKVTFVPSEIQLEPTIGHKY